MAISFSRPDPASPAAVGSAGFSQVRRGYDPGEVRDFLRMVAAELARLQERERFLEGELRAMQTRGMSTPGRLDEETVTTLLGEEAARVLAAARDASVQIRDRAEESATRMVKEAAEDASRIRESATLDANRIREEAAGDAEAEVELAKQQGRDMVVEAREYREKVLSELARRRDAARAQIDKLLQDRERLLTAFGRAKSSSEEALLSLADAHDEPDPFVTIAMPPERPRVNPNHPSVAPAIYDRAAEDAEDVQDVRVDTRIGTGEVENTTTHETPVDVVDDAADNAADNAAKKAEVDEAFTEIEIHDVTAEVGDDTVVPMDESSEIADSPEEADGETLAPVVELFGTDRRGTARATTQPDDVPEPVATEPVVPEPVVTESVVTGPTEDASSAVDDIFARLRAATVEEVSAAATASVAATDDTKAAPVRVTTVSIPTMFAARDAALAPVAESLAKRLKRAMMDEQNDVLEHLSQRRSSLEPEAILGASDSRISRYLDAIGADAMAAATEGAKTMKGHGGSPKRVTSTAVDETVRRAVEERVLAPVGAALADAVAASDGDRGRISEAARGIFRDAKSRADEVAADLARVAHARGAYLSLEPGTRVCWMTDPDGSACADCEDNSLAGDVAAGEVFPTGDVHPGAHHGCRCLLGPAQH